MEKYEIASIIKLPRYMMAELKTIEAVDMELIALFVKVNITGTNYAELRSEVEHLKSICQQKLNKASSEKSSTKLKTGALIGGGIGLLFGPLGVIAGAAIGGAFGNSVKESERDKWQKCIKRTNDLLSQISSHERQLSNMKKSTPAKSIPKDISFQTKIIGVQYKESQEYIKRLVIGDILFLARESSSFDRFMVVVHDTHKNIIGHLPDEINTQIAPLLDTGKSFDVKVTEISTDKEGHKAVKIDVRSGRNIIEAQSKQQRSLLCDEVVPKFCELDDEGIYIHEKELREVEDSLPCPIDDYFKEDEGEKAEDLYAEGLGIGDVKFEDADSEY